MKKRPPTIIPVAGGKGGVGKTFIAANLSFALAEMGHSTVAVDMDLGGSNLHTLLGLSKQYPGIGDFLKARSAELEDLIVPTRARNLSFIPGDGLSPFMANIPYAQKIRLISRIKKIPAEYIVLDLGAGTSFNTLDFFRMSSHGLVVTTPEYTSLMCMLLFLKLFLLRVIDRAFSKNKPVRDLLHSLYKRSMNKQQMDMASIRSEIRAVDKAAEKTVTALCRQYRPRVIFNMGKNPEQTVNAKQVSHSLNQVLSLEVDHLGFIFADRAVSNSVEKRRIFLPNYTKSMAALNIRKTAERIVKFGGNPIEGSALLLEDHTRMVYEKRMAAKKMKPSSFPAGELYIEDAAPVNRSTIGAERPHYSAWQV